MMQWNSRLTAGELRRVIDPCYAGQLFEEYFSDSRQKGIRHFRAHAFDPISGKKYPILRLEANPSSAPFRLAIIYEARTSKPSRRETFRFVGKLYKDPLEGERSFHVMQILERAGFDQSSFYRIPRALAFERENHLLLQEFCLGTSLRRLIGGGNGGIPEGFKMAGEWLARLHSLKVDLPRSQRWDLPFLPRKLQLILTHAGVMGFQYPSYRPLLSKISELLFEHANRPFAQVVTHGDYHATHVVLDGGHVSVIDLDNCDIGNPIWDLSTFLAQCIEQWRRERATVVGLNAAVSSFAEAYEGDGVRLSGIDLSSLSFLLALHFVELGFFHSRIGRDGVLAERNLERARWLLEESDDVSIGTLVSQLAGVES